MFNECFQALDFVVNSILKISVENSFLCIHNSDACYIEDLFDQDTIESFQKSYEQSKDLLCKNIDELIEINEMLDDLQINYFPEDSNLNDCDLSAVQIKDNLMRINHAKSILNGEYRKYYGYVQLKAILKYDKISLNEKILSDYTILSTKLINTINESIKEAKKYIKLSEDIKFNADTATLTKMISILTQLSNENSKISNKSFNSINKAICELKKFESNQEIVNDLSSNLGNLLEELHENSQPIRSYLESNKSFILNQSSHSISTISQDCSKFLKTYRKNIIRNVF